MSDVTVVAPSLEGVFYTDGGCQAMEPGNAASRGYAGWGLHGYLFTREVPKVGAGAKKGVPSAMGYDLKGSGKGTVTVHQYVDAFASIAGEGTNNVAELMGAIEAIKLSCEHNLSQARIITDSKYVVEGVEKWMINWRQRGWTKADGQDIINLDLWKELDAQRTLFESMGGKLIVSWVKGHSGDPGNTLADRYATRGRLALRNQSPINVNMLTDAKGYWKPANDRNRMLSLANWYFTTSRDMDRHAADGRSIYYLGDIRESEEFFGKPISDASLAVVYLKEPEPVLDQLREHFIKMSRGSMQGLIASDLRTVFTSDIYDALITYGDKLLTLNRGRQSINHMDKVRDTDADGADLGHEIRPTRMAFVAINILESLEGVLNAYLKPSGKSNVRMTDVTAVLYERTENKGKVTVKLHPAISTTTGAFNTPVSYMCGKVEGQKDVCLTLGQDLPDRNTLAALAGDTVKVVVVTWPESDQAFRYATIIEADGDVGIWSGPYANLQLLDTTVA